MILLSLRLSAIGIFVALSLFCSCLAIAKDSASNRVVLKDVKGDIGNVSEPFQDIIELRFSSANSHLLLEIETAASALKWEMDQLEDPPKEELNVSVGKLLLLSIDSDNNDATGDTPLLPGHDHVKGFEWSVGVTVCSVEKEDTKVTNYCNPGGYNTIAAIPRVDFVRHNSNIFEDDQIFGGEVKGSVVKVQIPYVKIGVSAGKTIRIYAIENALPTINTFDKRFEPVELKLE